MANETDTDYEYTEAEEIQFLIGNTIIPAIAHTLALFPTIPIDVYIVYRLMFKKIKKTAYFCIIMLMCAVDVYDCFFEARDFLDDYIEFLPILTEFDNTNHQILYYVYAIQKLFVLIIFINFKSSVKKKTKVDLFLYATAVLGFIIYYSIEVVIVDFFYEVIKPIENLFKTLSEYSDYFYFTVYLSTATYCFVVLRLFNTASYSSHTLKVYKRMATAHYIQTSYVVIEFIYFYPIFDICRKNMSDDFFFDYFIFPFGVFNYVYTTVAPFFRAITFFWALRGIITVQSTGNISSTATVLATVPIFTRRATEGAQGVSPSPTVHQTTTV